VSKDESMMWTQKYRPNNIHELVGNQAVVD